MLLVVEAEEEDEGVEKQGVEAAEEESVELVSLSSMSMSSGSALSGGRGWWRSVGEAGPLDLESAMLMLM